MVGKIYLEFLVNARVVHVVIHAEPSDVTRLSFQPLEIAIDGKVICNWSETSLPVLIPSSITSVRHVCSDGLFHASFNTKPSLIPNLVNHTILITHHEADQPTLINCHLCDYRLLEYKFKRCLSLPSDGWSEMMGDVFCHDHEGDSIQHHLIPNKDDLFYGEDTNTIHLLTDLLTGSVLIQPTDNIRMLRCKRCLEYIGTASSDVQYNTARLDLIKVCCSNFDVVSLQKIVALKMIKLSQELCCYNFVITTKAAHHERVIEIRSLRSITWMLMDSIKPKTGGSDTSHNVDSHYTIKLALKVMFSFADNPKCKSSETIVLPTEQFHQLQCNLMENHISIPTSLRNAGSLNVSYLEIDRQNL